MLNTDDFLKKHVLTQELDLANVSEASPSIIAYLQDRINMINDRENKPDNGNVLY